MHRDAANMALLMATGSEKQACRPTTTLGCVLNKKKPAGTWGDGLEVWRAESPSGTRELIVIEGPIVSRFEGVMTRART